MKYKLVSLNETQNFREVTEQMDDIYGEQEHIPDHILKILSEKYPELFQVIYSNKELVGHLIVLPFNETGLHKITDDENDEGDFELSDFNLDRNQDSPVYFFVYSIYGKNVHASTYMIKQMCRGVKSYENEVSSSSFIFAECVSPEGVRLSEKLGLHLYHSYNFRGTDLHLYKTDLKNFGSVLSSLDKPSHQHQN
ncbi:hypothetical protein ACJVC5_01400 [Peredibacter sp. HCB2-198]|uniref:hypothetical protein n=1 Tax=Peredibacter sp. HCB2-198 TaxID=3383025 RepID=UPI0038B6A16A